MREYRWAVIGCGAIASELAETMKRQDRAFYGVWNRTSVKAADFAKKYGVLKVYEDVYDMFMDEAVDIIYLATPHNTHKEFLLEALNCGKHVLCEKSITLNTDELKQAVEMSRRHQAVLAEAMTIYHMPLFKKIKEKINNGVLGPLRMVQINFGCYKEYDMENRFFNRNLAGGALLDIGVYAISFARWFLSEKPDQVVSQVKKAPTGVDEQAGILLMNQKEEMVSITLSLHAAQPKRGTAVFDKGYIEIYEFPRAEQAVITYTENGKKEVIEVGKAEDALMYEVWDMEQAVTQEVDVMHIDYTTDVMSIMTQIRDSWGMKYPEEEEEA